MLVFVDYFTSPPPPPHTHIAGTPGFVTSPIIALADSQSQIFISWLYPIDHNVLDPTLLRYEVFYQEGTLFDLSSASSNTGLLPVLLNGQISEVGDVQTTLTGLNPGTTYSVAIRAVSTASPGGLGGGTVIVSTFGNGKCVCDLAFIYLPRALIVSHRLNHRCGRF